MKVKDKGLTARNVKRKGEKYRTGACERFAFLTETAEGGTGNSETPENPEQFHNCLDLKKKKKEIAA